MNIQHNFYEVTGKEPILQRIWLRMKGWQVTKGSVLNTLYGANLKPDAKYYHEIKIV